MTDHVWKSVNAYASLWKCDRCGSVVTSYGRPPFKTESGAVAGYACRGEWQPSIVQLDVKPCDECVVRKTMEE